MPAAKAVQRNSSHWLRNTHTLTKRYTAMKPALVFLSGAAVGAIAALLLAPDNGAANRARLYNFLKQRGLIPPQLESLVGGDGEDISALMAQITAEIDEDEEKSADMAAGTLLTASPRQSGQPLAHLKCRPRRCGRCQKRQGRRGTGVRPGDFLRKTKRRGCSQPSATIHPLTVCSTNRLFLL